MAERQHAGRQGAQTGQQGALPSTTGQWQLSGRSGDDVADQDEKKKKLAGEN